MDSYDQYLVSGEALKQVLSDIHDDQQRQDNNLVVVESSMPTSLSNVDITRLWNEVFNK